MEKISLCKLIAAHLRTYGSIEPLTALREYGCYRLGARIKDLRDEGMDIKTERMEAVSRLTGRKIHYAKYKLKEKEK